MTVPQEEPSPLQDAYSMVRTARVALDMAQPLLRAPGSLAWRTDIFVALVHVRRVLREMEHALGLNIDDGDASP